MKNLTILTVSMLLLLGCGSEKQQNGIPTIDVNKSYPQKEIILQDIAEVTYTPLETRNDVLLGETTIVPVGKDKILAYSTRSGDVFLFNNNGKFIHKFNHRGQSGEEYNYISNVFADVAKDELYIMNASFPKSNILVYDMKGKYKRTLEFDDIYGHTISFGKKYLLSYNNPSTKDPFGKKKQFKPSSLIVLNKEKQSTEKTIQLPTTEGVTSLCFFKISGHTGFMSHAPKLFVKTNEGLLVNDVACNNVFLFNNSFELVPILERTPKVSPNDNPQKMVGVIGLSKKAIYLDVTLNVFNPKTRKGFDKTSYQLQRSNNKIVEYTLKNSDCLSNKKWASLKQYVLMPADELIQYLEEGKLKGKLKNIAEKLKEDDNPVLMKVTLK